MIISLKVLQIIILVHKHTHKIKLFQVRASMFQTVCLHTLHQLRCIAMVQRHICLLSQPFSPLARQGAIYFYNTGGQCPLNEVCGYDCCSTNTSVTFEETKTFLYVR